MNGRIVANQWLKSWVCYTKQQAASRIGGAAYLVASHGTHAGLSVGCGAAKAPTINTRTPNVVASPIVPNALRLVSLIFRPPFDAWF